MQKIKIVLKKTIAEPSTQVAKSLPDITIPVYPENQWIDLLSNKNLDLKNENQPLVDQFNLLVEQIEYQIRNEVDAKEKTKHRFRLQQIKKAIAIFEDYPEKITSGAVAQKTIAGIGKGIGARIDEIMKTGTLSELTDKHYVNDITRTIKELTEITGIGEIKARQLIDTYGVTGVKDLQEKVATGVIKVAKNQLTHHIMVGLTYYDDFKKKIPRAEMQEIEHLLLDAKNQLDPKLILQVAGSYRRERPFSGDVDVLLTHPDLVTDEDVKNNPKKYLIELVNLFTKIGFIVDSLTDKGQTKYMGVCRISKDGIHRRIDIRFMPYDSYAPALMYFTGSMQFNKISRGIANQKGYTLNEYGIYNFVDRVKGDKIPVFSEEDIFKIIGIKYLTPKQRDL